MRVTYAIITLVYGIFLLAVAIVWRAIPFAFLRSDNAMGISFAVSAAMAIPFVVTYTTLGLNSAEGEKESPETRARHAALRRKCPIWQIAWFGGIGLILASWVGGLVFHFPVHPFFAFSGVLSCLTGVWFLFAYPVASRLFKS
jgi:hypothetical protein